VPLEFRSLKTPTRSWNWRWTWYFLDELAALTKLNQIILERVPISLEDPWPHLINDYSAKPREGEEPRYEAYKDCLSRLLKKDFMFYSIYNPNMYFSALRGNATGVQALLAQGLIMARNKLIMAGAEEMGRKYEHGKWVISYYPFSCKCPFYSQRFEHLAAGSARCRQIAERNECPFFTRPTEEMLYEYLLQEGGLDAWEDLKIAPDCLRVVEGETLGSFKTVYYTLFPDHLRDEAAAVDADLEATETELKSIQARLKEKNLSSAEENRLEKKKRRWKKQLQSSSPFRKNCMKQHSIRSNRHLTRSSKRKNCWRSPISSRKGLTRFQRPCLP
jgi:hypothetical protein